MAARTVNYRQGEKIEEPVLLGDIRSSQNPRQSLRGVLEKFHEEGAAHNDAEKRAAFVTYIDEDFPFIRQRAESIKAVGQLQAVTLRRYDSNGEDKYGIVQGECRILAWALIEAESGVAQKVRAVIEPKMTLDESFERAMAENLEREDMSPLDIAASFNEMLTVRINPATVKPTINGEPNPLFNSENPKGRPYTLKEIAAKFRRDYHWVRSRAALVYLPQADKVMVEANHKVGKRDLTRFCKKACLLATQTKTTAENESQTVSTALAEVGTEKLEEGVTTVVNSGIVTVQPERRRRVKSLKEVVALFDATPLESRERLQALAEVMGISDDPKESLRIALEEREKRAESAEIRSGEIADREARQQQSA